MPYSLPHLYIIGHTDHSLKVRSSEANLPIGEINNAKKIHKILKANLFPVSDIQDIYELFGIEDIRGKERSLLADMYYVNSSLISAGQEMITDFDNKIANNFRSNLEKLIKHENAVLLFLTWRTNIVGALSTGIQNRYPIIAKEDSYAPSLAISHYIPLPQYSRMVNVLLSESLLGALNLYECGVLPSRFLLFPNIVPIEKEEYLKIPNGDKEQSKRAYLEKLFVENKKNGSLPDNPLVIGCSSRFSRRKNIEFLLYAMHEIHKKHPHILLVLKGWYDSACDQLTLYSEKVYQLIESAKEQPWFFLDNTETPFPEVLKVFSYFDIGAMISGAELGCNTVTEMCAMGVPTVLLDATVNPFLYQGMALMSSERKKITKGKWVFSQPNIDDLQKKLESLIVSKEKREKLGKQAMELADQRFGAQQLLKRIPLMVNAASHFFHQTEHVKDFERKLYMQLMRDLEEYHFKGALETC